jgi:hypothetical protein
MADYAGSYQEASHGAPMLPGIMKVLKAPIPSPKHLTTVSSTQGDTSLIGYNSIIRVSSINTCDAIISANVTLQI